MGSAYTSVADDASALFWNPAGLPWIGHQEISGTHANLFESGINDNLISFVLPLSPRSVAAIDWYHSGFEDQELSFGESRIDLAYARMIGKLGSVGATGKYLSRGTDLDGVNIRQGRGVGLDLAAIATPLPRLRVGAVVQDLFDTNVSYSDGQGTAVAYPMNFRFGASYSPVRGAIVAFDADDRYHLGGEYRVLPSLAVRAGIQDDWSDQDGITWSAGAGVKTGILRFEYARVEHPTLGATNHFGLAMEFNFNPAQIRIEKVEPKDLFASLHKVYARRPVATVRVRNLDDRPLATTLRVLIPDLMENPTEQEVILRPMAVEEVPVTAVLSERAMERPGNRSIHVQVSASYQAGRLPRTEKASAKGTVYGPGAIDWSQGVDQAAAFITTRDPAVESFARDATRAVTRLESGVAFNRNVTFAAAIVDALASAGLSYVPDPNNPYSAISETPRAVDTIFYPRDTLARLVGDCDDTSVLLAALLENLGIATKLVDVPGHIFLLVDTGIHARNRSGLALEENLTVVDDERVWIPVETTSLGKGFAEAWREGSESHAAWAQRSRVELVDVEESFSRYEPGEAPGPQPAAMPRPDAAALLNLVTADLAKVGEWREAYLHARFGNLHQAPGPSPEARNEIAQVYFLAGKFEQARRGLEEALAGAANHAPSLSNLGTVLAAQRDLPGAVSRYEKALTLDRADPGVWLNLGLVRYAMGDTAGAEEPLAEGIARSGGYDAVCRILALVPDPVASRGGTRKLTDEEARALLRDALRKVPRQGAATPAEQGPESVKQVASKRWISRGGAGRSANPAALHEHLYWKER
jgi:Flp pilus assembly protein TadD